MKDRAGQTEIEAEKAFFTQSHPSTSHSRSSRQELTTEKKKAKALTLKKLKKKKCCNTCGVKGHFSKECPNASDESDDDSSRSQHHRRSKRESHSHNRKKKSHANITSSSIRDLD